MPSLTELFEFSATDVVLVVLFVYVVYKLFFKRRQVVFPEQDQKTIVPPLKKQDMTVEQLRRFDGVADEHICLAVCGKIYDVTKGRDFYGTDGAYGEGFWKNAKKKNKEMCGTTEEMLPSYLDEFQWRQLYGRKTVVAFDNILDQISNFYPVNL